MRSSSTLPLAVACLGIATYALMDALMKRLGLAMGAYNGLLWRTAAGALLTAGLYGWRRSGLPSRAVLKVHAARSAVVAVMALCFFWGITQMPLAEAVALSFIAPLIALGLAALFLGEQVGVGAVGGSVLGLAGVAVILAGRLGDGFDAHAGRGAAAVLVSAILYAVNLVMARHQAQLAEPIEIAFFQNLFVFGLLALGAPALAALPRKGELWAIAAAALLGVGSLMLISWAYARAQAQVLLPVEYTAFVWASLMGWLFFGEALTPATVGGTVLIIAGCLIAARQRGGAGLPESEALA